jgi:hypothetical protein
MLRNFALAALLCVAATSWAQLSDPDPDWKESEVPRPPALRTTGLVAFDVSGGSELRYGIDPQSVGIGADKVVRLVVVASSRSGAINAIYEGLRCDRAEYRIYARNSGQGWREVETEWKSMFGDVESRHVRTLAQSGVCRGRIPNGTPGEIVRDVGSRMDHKFGGSSAP